LDDRVVGVTAMFEYIFIFELEWWKEWNDELDILTKWSPNASEQTSTFNLKIPHNFNA